MKINRLVVLGALLLACASVHATNQPWSLGNVNVGLTQFNVLSQVTVSTNVPVAITATYEQVESTGGTVLFGITSSYPAISTAAALSGQYILLSSTSTTSTVSIATGAATGVQGDDQFIVLSGSKSPVGFIFDSTLSLWREIGRQ